MPLPQESEWPPLPPATPGAGGSPSHRLGRPGALRPGALRPGGLRPGALQQRMRSRGPLRPGGERRARPGGGRWPGARLPLLGILALLLGGCVRPAQHSSGRVFPLMRHTPGDGLAVVNGARGSGIHIWLDPDTETAGLCRPRWNPDPARLRGGDGPHPRSSGRAPRAEFYAALRRGPVRLALHRQMAALCRQRAPDRRFQWQPPPRSDAEVLPVLLPMLEEEHLLSNPTAVRRSEKQLLGLPLTARDWEETPPPPPPEGP